MSYLSTVLAKSPLVGYAFDETSGSSAVDATGSGHSATYNGSPTLGAAGLVLDGGTCVALNGTSQYAQIPDGAWIDALSTGITLEAWIDLDTVPSGSSGYIIARGSFAGEFAIGVGLGVAFVQMGTTAGNSSQSGATALDPATRYHIVGTYDGADMKIYVNAVEDGSAAKTGTLFNTSRPIGIGANVTPSASGFLDGRVDWPMIYPRALSAAEIAANYAAGTTAPPTTGSGSLSLAGAGLIASTPASGAASIALSGTGVAGAALSGSGSITLGSIGAAFALFVSDLTNAMNGRRRHARGTATVTRPPATPPPGRTFAKRYDKAIAYPIPDVVDGRPE